MNVIDNIKFQLIVTIVNRGYAPDVVEASKKGGAEGGTIINGRGSGIHEQMKFFGITIEPEKEIVLTVVDEKITVKVLESISKFIDIDKPGNGIAFVLDVPMLVGINHLKKK